MTSFASAFGSSDEGENNTNDHQGSNHFSSIDLGPQSNKSPYVSLNDAATFQANALSTADAMPDIPPSATQELRYSKSFSSSSMSDTSSLPPGRRISATSAAAVAAVVPTIDKLKQWSRTTFKCTKQSIYEKLGKTARTVDVELDAQIEQLRETKRRYENMLALARSYANHFFNLVQTQKGLSAQFLELKHKTILLCDEFGYNAETQRLLVQNGEILLNALNYFISTLNTLCSKTIDDTINTIRLYEISRLEYDACRTEMELLPAGIQLNEKQCEYEKYKEKYEQLKCSVGVKLRLLDENQTKVMKNQLLLFHNAISAYFSGNKEALHATIKQFNIKMLPDGDKELFLEQSHH